MYILSKLHLQTSGVWKNTFTIFTMKYSWKRQDTDIYIQGKLAHMINDFRFLRKELLELHCRIDIGSSFQKDAPIMKDRENFP